MSKIQQKKKIEVNTHILNYGNLDIIYLEIFLLNLKKLREVLEFWLVNCYFLKMKKRQMKLNVDIKRIYENEF